VDEQEQMHVRDVKTQIKRRALVAWKGFVQHGAKLVLGDAGDPSKATALLLWRMICAAGILDSGVARKTGVVCQPTRVAWGGDAPSPDWGFAVASATREMISHST